VKPTTPMGQLPIFEVGGTPIVQAQPILKYAGTLAKIYPTDDSLSALQVDEMQWIADDIQNKYFGFQFESEEKKAEIGKTFVEEVVPAWFAKVEKLLASRGQTEYSVGSSLTTADLAIWNTHKLLTGRDFPAKERDEQLAEEFKNYPTLVKIEQNVANHKMVKDYYAPVSQTALTYKLSYFDLAGRAEPIRIALTGAGVSFEEVRYSFAEWPAVKPTTPMGQLPILEVGGTPIVQAFPILKYAGTLAKIYPTDDALSALQVDEMQWIVDDITNKFVGFVFESEEKKAELGKTFVEETAPAWFAKVENLLASRGQTEYAVGSSLTTADLAIWNAHKILTGRDFPAKERDEQVAEEFKKYPTLVKIEQNVANHEMVKAYYTAMLRIMRW